MAPSGATKAIQCLWILLEQNAYALRDMAAIDIVSLINQMGKVYAEHFMTCSWPILSTLFFYSKPPVAPCFLNAATALDI